MQIAIEIPDAVYEIYKSIDLNNEHWDEKYYVYCIAYSLLFGLQDGQPIPKGYGRLVDMSKVIVKLMQYYDRDKTIGQCLDEVPTVIEADWGDAE